MDSEALFFAIQVAGFTVVCLAALLGLTMQLQDRANLFLTFFFAFIAASELSATAEATNSDLVPSVRDSLRGISFVATTLIAPAFLFHVIAITTAGVWRPGRQSLLVHLVLPLTTVLVVVVFLTLPASDRALVFRWSMVDGWPAIPAVIAFSFAAAELMIYLQWVLVAIFIFGRIVSQVGPNKYSEAHTAGLKMNWILALTVMLGGYGVLCLITQSIVMMGYRNPLTDLTDSSLVLIIVLTLTLWGVRPRSKVTATPGEVTETAPMLDAKYAKSALSDKQAARIARKLDAAMRDERLYRDANLTLPRLSQHIGASPNYVSQTLNERLGVSFFEYVNRWRVDEAVELVTQGNLNILAIAYEVGFNSRSSFYTAFKARTGQTPTSLRRITAATQPIAPNCMEKHEVP
ncbi:AraC family transcriptional regulator [uncultured Roseobacter sp.]|uniref:helix-turn-helix domain-containing protein n=1 Tax=uncultured Roseobacter sp. TaxID=114847 RepID=UPI0026156432|nr:AraC family transcriptional regulator [uncultured Roseobacter sp.]